MGWILEIIETLPPLPTIIAINARARLPAPAPIHRSQFALSAAPTLLPPRAFLSVYGRNFRLLSLSRVLTPKQQLLLSCATGHTHATRLDTP